MEQKSVLHETPASTVNARTRKNLMHKVICREKVTLPKERQCSLVEAHRMSSGQGVR